MSTPSPAPPPSQPSFIDQFWPHLTVAGGAVAAVALGAADHFLAHDAWGVGVDLSLIWAGLGALGVAAVAAVKQ
jgi:hypothetical protein